MKYHSGHYGLCGGIKMRYIRTKDGRIFEVMSGPDENEWYEQKGGIICLPKKKIIKKSDTIEELYDEFVDTSELKVSSTSTGGWLYDEFDSDNKCLIYYAEDERRTIPLNEFDDLSKIYGAIWTNKGLIYVAKMNDKGELELL